MPYIKKKQLTILMIKKTNTGIDMRSVSIHLFAMDQVRAVDKPCLRLRFLAAALLR